MVRIPRDVVATRRERGDEFISLILVGEHISSHAPNYILCGALLEHVFYCGGQEVCAVYYTVQPRGVDHGGGPRAWT